MSDFLTIAKAIGGSGAGSGGAGVGKGGGSGMVGTTDQPFNPAAKLATGVSQGQPTASVSPERLSFSDILKMYTEHKAGPGVKDTSMANGFGDGNKVVPGTGKGGASG